MALDYSPCVDDSVSLSTALEGLESEMSELVPVIQTLHALDAGGEGLLEKFKSLDAPNITGGPELAAVV